MIAADAQLAAAAESLQTELVTKLFGFQALAAGAALTTAIPPESNIVGFGLGAKMVTGERVEELAVRVYVRAKLTAAAAGEEVVPRTVNGTPTDVIPVGDLIAHWPRPVRCGVSVGHHLITAGTLGCVVNLAGNPGAFILSNNHVLANSNVAAPGDDILEPGPTDGGAAHPRIAGLHDFEPINFAGGANTMDAAIASIDTPADVDPTITVIGRVAPPMTAALYQSVRKHGRTTAHTVGVVMDLAASIKVRYGPLIAHFRNQLAVQGVGSAPFSSGGDSGSLIVDAVHRNAVGLLFAGGNGITFGNPIDAVLARFNATIA